MKKTMLLAFALALAGSMGVGAVTDASARTFRGRDFSGVWQLDAQRGDTNPGGMWNGSWGNNDRNGSWGNNDRNGGWGNNDRYGRNDSYGRGSSGRGWGNAQGGYASLPQMIQIEQFRREIRVTGQNGRTLRQIDTRFDNPRDGQLHVETTGFGGLRIVEDYSLRGRGDRLVVHTQMIGPRGTREFTSIYERA